MSDKPKDEAIDKFIKERGYDAWIKFLSTGEVADKATFPNETPQKGSASGVVAAVKNALNAQ